MISCKRPFAWFVCTSIVLATGCGHTRQIAGPSEYPTVNAEVKSNTTRIYLRTNIEDIVDGPYEATDLRIMDDSTSWTDPANGWRAAVASRDVAAVAIDRPELSTVSGAAIGLFGGAFTFAVLAKLADATLATGWIVAGIGGVAGAIAGGYLGSGITSEDMYVFRAPGDTAKATDMWDPGSTDEPY